MFYLTNLFLHTFIIRKDTHFYIKIAFEGEKLPCGHHISRRNRWKTTKKAKKTSGNEQLPLVIHISNQILLLQSCNLGTQSIKAGVDITIAAVNLLDVLDCACALGAHGGDEQCHSGANIGRGHCRSSQVYRVVVAYDRSSVWVAQDNLGSHIDEFIYEEESALEHFLVNQYRTFCLSRNHQEYR